MTLNRLTDNLRRLCSSRPLEEKRLLAPSLRVGRQWLDAVARSGTAVLNVRVMTVAGMALELAAPEMERLGLSFATGLRLELILEDLLARGGERNGYLGRLEASRGLARALAASFHDLRMAGVDAGDLAPSRFEVPEKGEELAFLFSAYEERLDSLKLADLPAALRMAERRLRETPDALPPACLLLLPSDLLEKAGALERALWDVVPVETKVLLECDRPREARREDPSDAALLAWISRPAEAPMPAGDGSVDFFRAEGEANEVREVLRRCAACGIPFDEVEILYTDYTTYVPLIYEISLALFAEDEDIPVTFVEGIPARYSRPGRALAGWISWIRDDFPQPVMARLIEDGLLATGKDLGEPGRQRLAAVLRALPIGKGRERYGAIIRGELDAASAIHEEGKHTEDAEDADISEESSKDKRSSLLATLASLIEGLLADIPRDPGAEAELLDAAERFLTRHVRCASEFDEYARRRLLRGVREISACLRECETTPSDVLGRLTELVASSRVEGKGPRPGCLHVAPLLGGGHSGRPHVFVLGLDDGRFPGSGLQDPLLLDSEREAISVDLPTAAGRMASAMEELAQVMARLRARVTMGYCCRDLEDDRDIFPSHAILSAYRAASGKRDAIQDDFLRALREPVSFAPSQTDRCISDAEWWVSRLCGDASPTGAEDAVFTAYPHLGRGRTARLAREGDVLTAYDGFVPEAGADFDPARPDGPVLSARRLETLARCPLEYFFAYVLGVKPPEEYELDPSRWLEANERGGILHAVFRDFHRRLRGEGRAPCLERDWATLQSLLEDRLARWERRKPPLNHEAARVERENLLRCARIFLMEEEDYCRENRPLYFEAAAGMESAGTGNLIDSPEAVCIELPGGERIRIRGRIDRLDETGAPGSGVFSVVDYKTGSTYSFEAGDPFNGGRRVQHCLYLAVAERLLARAHPGARVVSFQYYFPSTREHGERIAWEAEELRDGLRILACLREMAASGCFPFTDDADDVKFSDYLPAFGNVGAMAERCKSRLEGPGNLSLDPLRRLRGYGRIENKGGRDD